VAQLTNSGKRPAHRPSRRDDILTAGAKEFVERGFAAVTVSDIARAANMTPSAVYYHFSTKDDIILELVRRIGDQVGELVSAGGSTGIDQSGRDLIARFVGWLDRHPTDARLYYVASVGVTQAVEELRRYQFLHQVTQITSGPLRPLRRTMRSTELKTVALALLVLLSEFARAVTSPDALDTGSRHMLEAEVVELGLRLLK
jgi:AcrR family transcriptional regulator